MPYNVERILLLASNLDTVKVASMMEKFDAARAVNIPTELLDSISDMITGIYVRKRKNKLSMLRKRFKNFPSYIYSIF